MSYVEIHFTLIYILLWYYHTDPKFSDQTAPKKGTDGICPVCQFSRITLDRYSDNQIGLLIW